MYTKVTTIKEIFGHKKKKKRKFSPKPSSPMDDVIHTDVPLMLRILEYARNEAKNDEDLHYVAKNLESLSNSEGTLTMEHYSKITTP
jgi:hypothetical protein